VRLQLFWTFWERVCKREDDGVIYYKVVIMTQSVTYAVSFFVAEPNPEADIA
ncbi:MAG: hypothetical protein ACI92E_003163, partial [Oceanicoccus sp.]